jgi:hypothetical protein
MTDWRPIETAPEDEIILIFATPDWVDTAWYINDEDEGTIWYWNRYDRIHSNLVPTAWMPLPEPPK